MNQTEQRTTTSRISPAGFRARMMALADPRDPARIGRGGWVIVGAILFLLLLPTLFFTLGHDQALFYVSGEKILDGAIHYRDIVDLKPPLIYHLYAVAITLFGGGAFSIRLFDLLLQGATCWLMIATIRRARGSDLVAALAPICYLLLYLSQRFGDAAQSEGYTALIGLAIVQLLLFRRTPAGSFMIGILAGVLFLLKFPLVVMLGVAVVADVLLFDDPLRNRLTRYGGMLAGAGVMFGLFWLYLYLGDAIHGLRLMSQFTSGYAKIELQNPGQWFRNLLTLTTLHFAGSYSMLLSLATAAGAAIALRPVGERSYDAPYENYARLLRFCSIAFLVLLVTVVMEGKYPGYHFIRLYGFGAILAAAGIAGTIGALARRSAAGRYRWFFGAAAICGALLFGPFIKYGWHAIVPAWKNLRAPAVTATDTYETLAPYYEDAEFRAIGQATRSANSGRDLFVMSSQGGLIYFYAGLVPDFKIYHCTFVISAFAPEEWRDSTREYLLNVRPRFIALDRSDSLPGITGSNRTSSITIRALRGIDSLLRTDYTLALETPSFDLFRRKEGD